MHFFDISNIAFSVQGYSVSYIELTGTIFGLISVYFASRANILTWATGIINEWCLFVLFFQVQLYADMLLQIYFFVVTLYGWYHWKMKPKDNSISTIDLKTKYWLTGILVIGTMVAGFIIRDIHLYLPKFFKIQAAYPFADSMVMVLSIVATVLLAKKKIETWYLWILVDLVCVALFFKKGIVFLGFEYLVFLGLATFGLFNWRKKLVHG